MRLRPVLHALFPPTCMLCGAPGVGDLDLCAGCAAELPWNRHACARCALPLDGTGYPGLLCGSCQRRAPRYDRCIAALRYATPVPALVGAAKFRGRLNAARLLGQVLAEAVRGAGEPLPEVLVPVPLHRARLAERGYNQALEIARVLGRVLALPMDDGCCERILATLPQAGLDEAKRRHNIRGAFRARSPLGWRHLAIVDDVVTTGSTVEELARVLRRAGAERIAVWAVARTP
ncbi:MAG: ComF family protein [Bdellovibrio bacteriovorus]